MILLAASSMAIARQSTSDEATPASCARNLTTHRRMCSSRASLVMTILKECSAFGMRREVTPLGHHGPGTPCSSILREPRLLPALTRYYREGRRKAILRVARLPPASLFLGLVITGFTAINAI